MTDAQTEARAIAQKLQDVVDANAADYPTVAAQQCRHHQPGCGLDREAKMITVAEGVFCDPCIAPLVAALNAAGVETIASCCGHTHRPGCIALRDGRELIIAQDYDEARKIEAMFPVDINGNTALSTITPAEVGELVDVTQPLDDLHVGSDGACDWSDIANAIDEVRRLHATALAAKDAELDGAVFLKDAAEAALRKREVEINKLHAQLAEARKALEQIERKICAAEHGHTINDVLANYREVRRTVQDARAARRALEAQGGE